MKDHDPVNRTVRCHECPSFAIHCPSLTSALLVAYKHREQNGPGHDCYVTNCEAQR